MLYAKFDFRTDFETRKGGSGGMSQAVGNTGGLSTVMVGAARDHIKEPLQSPGSP